MAFPPSTGAAAVSDFTGVACLTGELCSDFTFAGDGSASFFTTTGSGSLAGSGSGVGSFAGSGSAEEQDGYIVCVCVCVEKKIQKCVSVQKMYKKMYNARFYLWGV